MNEWSPFAVSVSIGIYSLFKLVLFDVYEMCQLVEQSVKKNIL